MYNRKPVYSSTDIEPYCGLRVDVYFNLHTGLWSVRDRSCGRVIFHSPEVVVVNASFVVSEAGRQRVLRERRKNVHAYVRGQLYRIPDNISETGFEVVKYNPYKYSSFVRAVDEYPVHNASFVWLTKDKKVFAKDLR